jgi:hypothetical protein
VYVSTRNYAAIHGRRNAGWIVRRLNKRGDHKAKNKRKSKSGNNSQFQIHTTPLLKPVPYSYRIEKRRNAFGRMAETM